MFRKKKSSEKLPTSTAPAAAAVGEKKSAPDQEKESVQASAAKQTTVSAAAAVTQPQEKPVVKSAGSTAASQQQTLAPAAKPPAGETATVSPKLVDKTARKAKGAKGFFKRAPTIVGIRAKAAEATRLKEDMDRVKNWKRWGPYLSERQWATVREDYSPDGSW